MAIEIERKFLVSGDQWRTDESGIELQGVAFRQGYLPAVGGTTVRVRLQGKAAKLTIKGKTEGISRLEYEYDIPTEDAHEMLDQLCQKPLIEKTRYCRKEHDMLWEIDVFEGENAGLIVAEVELGCEQQALSLPDWVGQEVSGDDRYYNVNLVANPYQKW
jgi:adenylate cyclase